MGVKLASNKERIKDRQDEVAAGENGSKRAGRPKVAPKPCLRAQDEENPCPRMATSRGLCNACRATARKLVEDGKVTEAALVEAGVMLEKHSTPGARDFFLRAIK